MYLPSLRGLDKIGINDEAFTVYNLHMLILLSLGATQEWLYIFSSFNSASCYVRQSCTEPPSLDPPILLQ